MKSNDLDRQVGAVLFVATEPLSLAELAAATEQTPAAIETALESLRSSLAASGIMLTEANGRFGLASLPEASSTIARWLGAQTNNELSRPALETLAIVAYRQPITKTEVDQIRGVASDQTLRNLLQRGLIVEAGRADTPGKPVRYGTSFKFLHHFGLSSPSELPPLSQPDEA